MLTQQELNHFTCLYWICPSTGRVWAARFTIGWICELHAPLRSPQAGSGSKLSLLPEPQQPEKTFGQHLAVSVVLCSLLFLLQTVNRRTKGCVFRFSRSDPFHFCNWEEATTHQTLPSFGSFEHHNWTKRTTVIVWGEAWLWLAAGLTCCKCCFCKKLGDTSKNLKNFVDPFTPEGFH